MKHYSQSGDTGRTRLINGAHVSKDNPHIEACGAVDELSAALGLLKSMLSDTYHDTRSKIDTIQRDLIRVGAILAGLRSENEEILQANVRMIETWINTLAGQLPQLQQFVIPGEDPVSAHGHHARAVCRRAERRMAGLLHAGENRTDMECALRYINRLSDYLFVLSRQIASHPD